MARRFLSISASGLFGLTAALACGQSYFQASFLMDGGDGDVSSPGNGGAGGATGADVAMPPGSLGLDPTSATPLEYLDCATPPSPSGPAPDGGTLVSADTVIAYAAESTTSTTTFSEVGVSGQSFTTANRVAISGTPGQVWESQIIVKNSGEVDAGDVLLGELWVRCEVPLPGEDVCQGIFIIEDSETFDKAVQFPVTPGGQWQQVYVSVEAPQDYPVGAASFSVFLGYTDQTIDIGPIRVHNYGTTRSLAELPSQSLSYPGIDADAPWRRAAGQRIDDLRRGDISISVVDSAGAPVAGAEVRAKMLRHEFFFGTAITSGIVVGDEEPDDQTQYKSEVIRLFNMASAFNAMRWKPWAGDWGTAWNLQRGLDTLFWARDRGLAFRGHNLVWPGWDRLPESLQNLSDDPAALGQAVLDHIDEAMAATSGQVEHWDVVNQPFTHRDLMDILGDEVVIDWFQRARAGDPDARLFISDYGILSEGPGNTSHHDDLMRWVQLLDGAPLDGLALSGRFAHILSGPEEILEQLDRFGTNLDKEIAISQYEILVDDEMLAACFTHDFLTAIFSHPSVSTFQAWGFWADEDLVYFEDWTKRPAGQVYEDLVLQRWWTDETAITDASGAATLRGFFGEYEVTATVEETSRSARLQHTSNAPAAITLELSE